MNSAFAQPTLATPASWANGKIDGANVVKLHRFSGKVSYIACPGFEPDPHPPLGRTVKLSLRSLRLGCYELSEIDNPQLLDQKEKLIGDDHSLHSKFQRLTKQEIDRGLLDTESDLLSKKQWMANLELLECSHRGHRLVAARK